MRKRICFVVAVPETAMAFLSDHIKHLSEEYDVYLVSGVYSASLEVLPLAGFQKIIIKRNISIIKDFGALIRLVSYFRKMRFDSVQSVTPKAGFLTSIAAWLAHIKIRIHIYTGQVWATSKGLRRKVLKLCDRIIAILDSHILVDGNGQKEFLINNKIVSNEKAVVLANGSICGVNLDRFYPDPKIRDSVRHELGITEKVVFGFMGRLNKEKGIDELLTAFNLIVKDRPDAFLLLFGKDEENYSSKFRCFSNLTVDNFLYFGPTKRPYEHLQAIDVFVLPTYREGFGSSAIEASALGIPVITTNVYGVADAVIDKVTGLKCKVGDVDSLASAMVELYVDKEKRLSLGLAGRSRVESDFSGKVVTNAWLHYYRGLFS